MRADIVPGGTFPDYELPDHTDVPRKLSELQGDDPMILTLARGHYLSTSVCGIIGSLPGLVIHSIYNGYWFWGRPSVVDIWHDLRDVTREIRPDWDLSAPGLREAWDAGDVSPFHGWDKRDRPRDGLTAPG
jgi:hypothetical protein